MDFNRNRNTLGGFKYASSANKQERQSSDFISASEDMGAEEYRFGPAPRQPAQSSSAFFNPGRASFNVSQTPLSTPSLLLSRQQAASRNIYTQQEREPRTSNDATNFFRDNFRHGAPIREHSAHSAIDPRCLDTNRQLSSNMRFQRHSNPSRESPTTQLANAMLLDMPLPTRRVQDPYLTSQLSNPFQNIHGNRLNQLQPQKQQPTPPFNLSGFSYSPITQEGGHSSSPSNGQGSSPTARISLRRETSRISSKDQYSQEEDEYGEEIAPSQPSPQYTFSSQARPSQALALAHAPPLVQGIQLISPHQLSDRFRQVFPYELFNAVQSKCFEPIYRTNDNVIVAAPTGSGKTAILELAICKLIEGHGSGQVKIVYQAPTKSLCSERLRDWSKKFAHLNLPVAELTGDTSQREMTKVRNASIIVTTPEKWDSITRKWADHHKLVQLVKLFLIDEVHILKDTRGATLEVVVSRMKSLGANVRFVALSATVPNSDDIALWLGKNHTNQQLPAHRETFGEEFRPVKLQKHVHGYDGQMNDFSFQKTLDNKIPGLIQKYSQKKPIMVFCFTRKSCEATATLLAEWWERQKVVDRAWHAPTSKTVVGLKALQDLVRCGVSFHHAGLNQEDRHAIETGFLKGEINVICCTSTLAVGVNLPCHLVVLKGTVGYQDGILGEYSDLEVMQMLGRAGRPQFDDSAIAIIATRHDKVDRYKQMISGQDILESTLHLNLIEHLNSEISLTTINSLYTAKRWLLGTFLSIRMRQNPNYYKIEGVAPDRDTDHRLELVCERDIALLQDCQLITKNETFSCTEYGHAMSRYMIQFETMKLLLSIPKHAKIEEILTTICQAAEFKDLRMKPAERPHLREYNKSPFMKYAIRDNISTTAHKVFILIQVQLGDIDDPSSKDFHLLRRQFGVDKGIIFDRVSRLVRCVVDCKAYDCDAIATRHALDLSRSLSAECWENSSLQLRQIPGFGPAAVRKLATSNINTIEKLATSNTGDIERYMSRNPPFGRKLLDQIVGFPRLQLDAVITGKIIKSSANPKVHIRATLKYSNTKVPVWKNMKPSVVFTAETTKGTLAHIWRGNVVSLEKGRDIKFTAELSSPDEQIKCYISCEEIVGTTRSKTVTHDIPASAFPPTPKETPKGTPKGRPNPESEAQDTYMKAVESDEYEDSDIGEDDLIAAVEKVDGPKVDYPRDEFEDIDNFESESDEPSNKKSEIKTEGGSVKPQLPVKMANGRWACNHNCRDGKGLKNGAPCKHQCCKDGLDKPPKKSKKATSTATEKSAEGKGLNKNSKSKTSDSGTVNSKMNKRSTKLMLKMSEDDDSDVGSVEVVDLASEMAPTPYAAIAPRDYRKLHTLHTSVQADKSIGMPKRKPQFSYADDAMPNPSFLQPKKDDDDMFEAIDDDDFPSPSRFFAAAEDEVDDFTLDLNPTENPAGNVFFDQPFQVVGPELDDNDHPMITEQITPKANLSFANEMFDFNAFESQSPALNRQEDQQVFSALPELRKRGTSPSPDSKEPKYPRMSADKLNEITSHPPAPDWLRDMDPEILEGLMDIVEFVD